WSPMGDRLVYTSSTHPDASNGLPTGLDGSFDLYKVGIDVANGVFGGDATKLEGASDPNVPEYHPTVSPDGELVAFTRGGDQKAGGEIWITKTSGGPATKLVGDDDPSTTDLYAGPFRSSWPRFTPEVTTAGDDRYYTIAFSSQRGPGAAKNDDAPAT